MAVASETTLAIHLETECPRDGCAVLAQNLLDTLDTGRYDRCAVLKIPATIDDWTAEHRTARKRAMRAERHGYRFQVVKRHEHADDIYAINTSLAVRQGRPMTAGYKERPSETPLTAYACGRHAIRTYGILSADRRLVAYLWLYRAGDLALVSSILGHADHLDDGIMFLLMQGVIDAETGYGNGALVYNRFDSGTDGLRWYKERCGFSERQVEWCR
jgi:hypothetical protein